MKKLIVRCSELSNLMTKSRSKSEPLSETTKSWLKEKAKENFYGFREQLDTPAINKGIDLEDTAIEMLNDVDFKSYTKNTERRTNEWLTGEADIVADEIIDIKNSWSLKTFPAFKEDAEKGAKKSGYDWQLRGYMFLWEKPKAAVSYCMVSTPDYLLKDWDDRSIHKVDHIPQSQRITKASFERDEELEKEMLAKYELANEYYQELITELSNK